MKLMCEDIWDIQKEILQENVNAPKNYFVAGITLQSNRKNLNDRFYPDEYVNREVSKYLIEKLETKRGYGEYGHPDNTRINEERISHRFVEIKKSGNDYISKAIISPEGLGKLVRGIIDIDGTLGMSSRSVGSLKEDLDRIKYVQSDLRLITPGDIVIDPSAKEAFVRGIKENVEYELREDGMLIEHVIHSVDTQYKQNMSIEEKQVTLIKIFEEIVSDILKRK
jgi:hypothetical protein